MKKSILILLFLAIMNSINAQSNRKLYFSVIPAYELIFSQTVMHNRSVNIGFGYYNQYRFYISANTQFSSATTYDDPYNRKADFSRFSPGIKLKWLLIGENKYMSPSYFGNLGFCLDAGLYYNFSFNKLFYNQSLIREKFIHYLSTDLGCSFMIPFGYVQKNRNKFLNRSNLYLEFTESIMIHTDVSIISSNVSTIDNVTLGSRIGLNWTFLF